MRLRLAAVLAAATAAATPAPAAVVYSNDFESNTTGFNTASTTTLETTATPAGSGGATSTYLGRFANDSAVLSLSGLTAGTVYRVEFELFIGASWDGNTNGVGPDLWSLTVGGGTPTTLVDTTFQNLNANEQAQSQNYSDTNPIGTGNFASQTGADVAFTGGDFFARYAIYYFSKGTGNPVLTFTASGPDVTLTFAASNLQGVADEFWAIDNVVVESLTPAAVPAPGGLGLLAVGGVAALARRRRA